MGFVTYPVGDDGTTLQLGGPGLALVTSQTFSAASVSLNGCFTASYENYRVLLHLTSIVTAGVELNIRFRSAGSDDSSSNYGDQLLQGSGASATASQNASRSYARIGAPAATTHPHSTVLDLFSPNKEQSTTGAYLSVRANGTTLIYETGVIVYSGANAFDGFSIASNGFAGTTITGTVTVYGYQKG